MEKLPPNAVFPPPPVPHTYWTESDWYRYWKSTGGYTTK